MKIRIMFNLLLVIVLSLTLFGCAESDIEGFNSIEELSSHDRVGITKNIKKSLIKNRECFLISGQIR